MENEYFSHIRKKLKKELDKDRYRHTLGVAYTAACMAMRFEVDLDKAYLAGLLHDCAKCIPNERKYELCDEKNIPLNKWEQKNSGLLHAKLGAYIARDEYGVSDEDICDAITWHTTGRENMTILEKIIYIADYIEPRRTKKKNLGQIRKTAFMDLDEAMYLITRDTLEYLAKSPDNIDENTRRAYVFYLRLHNNKTEEME